ncbi:MAG: hypothetical protein J6M47_08130 [Clostridia bacterium]|nr:hypothetical protein [Clostridia bacterium]
MVSVKDRAILREIAARRMELAHSARNEQLYKDWVAYGASKDGVRPMIRIEIETFEHELLPDLLRCEGEHARGIETKLLRPMINFTRFEDDTIVPDYYPVSMHTSFVPFGLPVKKRETGGLGHHFIPYLTELEEDDHLLGDSVFTIDEAGTKAEEEEIGALFGDILPAKRVTDCAYSVPTQDIVHIMNMDDMYIAMMEEEDRFHAMMRRLTDDYMKFFRALEAGGHLRSHATLQHLGQGSYCFTDELKEGIEPAKLSDLWLFMDSQETAGISPHLYAELVFPYYREMMEQFGLVSYGCCEASHPIWDNCLSKVKNLRKVSISPWCDEEFMGERLQGTGVTYLRKPPATILGMDTPVLDEEATLACFRRTAKAAKGCKLEIAQRDVYMVGHSAEKVRRFVELARIGLEG